MSCSCRHEAARAPNFQIGHAQIDVHELWPRLTAYDKHIICDLHRELVLADSESPYGVPRSSQIDS